LEVKGADEDGRKEEWFGLGREKEKAALVFVYMERVVVVAS
jgi:hypothetical protein